MKKTVLIYLTLIMVMAGSFILNGCSSETNTTSDPGTQAGSAYQNIGSDELKSLIETKENLLVLDVREQFEYDQGHLANSILIPTSEFTNRVNELPKDKPIAVVCATGARSAQVSQYLVELGYKEIYNLSRGLVSWPDSLVK